MLSPARRQLLPSSSTEIWWFVPLLVLAPLLAVSGLVYVAESRQAREGIRDGLVQLAEVRETLLESHLSALETRGRLVTRNAELAALLDSDVESSNPVALERSLDDAMRADRELVRVAIYDTLGRLVSSHPQGKEIDPSRSSLDVLDELPQVEASLRIEFADRSDTPFQVLLLPVEQHGALLGFAQLTYTATSLLAIARDVRGMGATGEALVGLVQDEQVLFLNTTRFGSQRPLSAAPVDEVSGTLPVALAIAGEEGFLEAGYQDYRGVDVFAAIRHIEPVGWGMVVKIDQQEALIPVRSLARTLLLGNLVIGSLLLLLSARIVSVARRNAAELGAANQRLLDMLMASPFPAMLHADDGEVLMVSDSWLAATGYARDQFPTTEAWMEGALSTATAPFSVDDRSSPISDETVHNVRHRDGSELLWRFQSIPLEPVVQDRTLTLSMAVDVTEREALLNGLQRTQAQLESVLASMPLPFWQIDEKGRVLRCNRAAEETFGWRLEDVIGERLPLVPEHALGELENNLIQLSHGIAIRGVETIRQRSDGSPVPVRIYALRTAATLGDRPSFVVIYEDMTESRAQAAALELINAAVASLPVGVAVLDLESPTDPSIVFINPAFTDTTGYAESEILGGSQVVFPSPKVDAEGQAAVERALRHAEHLSSTLLHQKKDGTEFWNRILIHPLLDQAGRTTHLVVIQEDVSEARRVALEFEHRARLATIGELAGGIAHDFRNVLTAAQGLVELILGELSAGSGMTASLTELKSLCDRGARITNRLLTLSRRGVAETLIVDLVTQLHDAWFFLSHTVRDNIELQMLTPIGSRKLPVRLNPDNFISILLNLVRNADQAMPDGGLISLRVDGPVAPGEPPWWPQGLTPSETGRWARVSLADTGRGMDAETLELALDPYFTTKPRGEGTGLGLSTANAEVEQLGGRLWLESAPGMGTTVHILLPVIAEAELQAVESSVDDAPDGAAEEVREPGPTRTGTILLAEDDASVRRIFKRALERAGHRVLVAEDGRQAIDCFEASGDELDLLVTDGVMPKVSGIELARTIWRVRPAFPVLMTSGFLDDANTGITAADREFPMVFRQKPVALAELLEVVTKLLATTD